MKRKMIIAIAAGIVIGGTLFAKSLIQMRFAAGDLFETNLEALAEYEAAPGEGENCVDSPSDHCYYSYDGKNYNIERAKNKQ